ncbi:MAG: fibronectin type III domain-containing protein [Candidatus Peregrinibacteria bacterium]|nr:fibronectin type III domain-containing protein [Candidatus Peregrinibacteria bacterium]
MKTPPLASAAELAIVLGIALFGSFAAARHLGEDKLQPPKITSVKILERAAKFVTMRVETDIESQVIVLFSRSTSSIKDVRSTRYQKVHVIILSPLLPKREYAYLVKAMNVRGQGIRSGKVLIPDYSILFSPIIVDTVSDTAATIRWNTVSAGSGGVLFSSAQDPGKLIRATRTEKKGEEHVLALTGLTPNTKYWFYVYARNPFSDEILLARRQQFRTFSR